VCGYSCHDHFSEYDTVYHSWDVIRDILHSKITEGIVVEVGSPVLHKAALYNARIILFNNKVVAIRPKMILADGDNYF
jgi:NAD+ synthase (glutamine-hydrolysing)